MQIQPISHPLQNTSIPTFSLYGELKWPTPDLLHWESVAERSTLHNWIIRPHRHSNLWQLIFLSAGDVIAHIDGREKSLDLPCLLVLPPLCIHGFRFSPDVEGHVITLAAPLVETICTNVNNIKPLLALQNQLAVSERLNSPLLKLLNNLAEEYKNQNPFRDFVLQSLVGQLLVWIARENTPMNKAVAYSDNGKHHFTRFTQLIEENFRSHLPLEEYASKIGISKPHLNSICRQYADRTALQVIHQRLLLEAKRNLVYTVMTVSEISNSLGFSEPPYFTRFFKRLEGLSPQQFRQRQ